ncbi:unannotated protein [freshwater metagenome]|uniref:Acyl-coenzyme A thioesterase THEM4 n=1 Tax=freshwater metagenome TaxID=449393 RepID=A0A6J6QJF2_9ZZZZ|nr:PaaI family thioesterase [Actinomycetota bacterium]MSY27656.1 PaaI family thioesterase [Actinomycetota bacterium]MTB14939.1 PaaI family thioesterase [Actinomycetota bacterium]MTB24853.1 PaaI family thioesterase [Actinomycetota bacterium]
MARVPSTTPPADAQSAQVHPDAPKSGQEIPSHLEHCFGCGPSHPTGLRIRSTAGEGASITSIFTVSEFHQGAPGLAHGGILTLACDEVLGHLMWLLRKPAVTGRLETDFLLPVPVGSVIHLSAEILGVSGRKVYSRCEGRLNSPDGPVAIRAQSLFVIVDMQHFLDSAPEDYLTRIQGNPALMREIDSSFEVNP